MATTSTALTPAPATHVPTTKTQTRAHCLSPGIAVQPSPGHGIRITNSGAPNGINMSLTDMNSNSCNYKYKCDNTHNNSNDYNCGCSDDMDGYGENGNVAECKEKIEEINKEINCRKKNKNRRKRSQLNSAEWLVNMQSAIDEICQMEIVQEINVNDEKKKISICTSNKYC